MTAEQWVALINRVIDDVRENRAPPAPISTGSLADTLEAFHANLPAIILTLRAHQGIETGAAEILQALADAGVPHAAEFRNAILSIPGAMESAVKYLPMIVGMLNAFKPVPTWHPGPRVER